MNPARNPELIRNVWIEFSPGRLIAAPLAIAAILYAFALPASSAVAVTITLTENMAYAVLYLWGCMSVAGALPAEMRNNSWDLHRMSALGAWTVTWGKLLGPASYQWYCALILTALHMAALMLHPLGDAGLNFNVTYVAPLIFLLCGLLGHAVSFLCSLNTGALKRNEFFSAVIGIAAATGALHRCTYYMNLQGYGAPMVLNWHGLAFGASGFAFCSLLFFLYWAVKGCQLALRNLLQYKSTPAAWAMFQITFLFYITGYVEVVDLSHGTMIFAAKVMICYMFFALMAYLGAHATAGNLSAYKRFFSSIRGRTGRYFFTAMPAWFVSAAGMLTSLIIFFGLPFNDILMVKKISLDVFFLGILFIVIRDIAVFHLLYLGGRIRHAGFYALLYFALVYFILPMLLAGGKVFDGHAAAMALFFPQLSTSFAAAGLPLMVEAAAALMALRGMILSLRKPAAGA